MPEQRPRSGGRGGGRSGGRRNGMLSREQIAHACGELAGLVGRPVESVVAIERDGSSGWRVTAQVLEVERIPHSTDVLADYELTLDGGGELTGFHREHRYHRGQTEGD